MLKTSGFALGTAALAGCQRESSPSDEEREDTIEVGPGNKLSFDPETIAVPPDTTVTWVWKSHNHNVVADETPENASWDGTPGDPSITYGSGYTYEKTFSVVGNYTYYCQPHLSAGMTGKVIVE